MVVERRTPHGRLLGLLTAMLAACAFAPLAWATSDGAHDNQYFFVDSESALGPSSGQWEDITANGTGQNIADQDDGLMATPLDIGFDFVYFGQIVRFCQICANGYIVFGIPSQSFDNQPIPTVGLPELAIYGFWDDLFLPTANATVFTGTFGNPPVAAAPLGSRRFIVQFNNVTFFADQTGQFNSLSFQIILFEGTNDIEFRYQSVRGPLGRGDSATIGLEDETGTFGNEYEHDGIPDTNHVFDGLVIRWTAYSASIPNLRTPYQAGLYSAVETDKRRRHGEGSSLCFVTNASYGSPLAPEVRLLSRFRDTYLMPTRPGRDFVDFYYRSSPGLSTMISENDGVKLPVQMALRPPIWFASFMLFSTAAEKAAVAALVLVLGMVLGRAMCRRLAEPER